MAKDLLTDAKLRASKPAEKPFKLSDGGGLFLLVTPNGARLWRLKYRLAGKEGLYAVGRYPEMGLAAARAAREDARTLIARGIHPAHARRDERDRNLDELEARKREADSAVSKVAEDWLAHGKGEWANGTYRAKRARVERRIVPAIGDIPMARVTLAQLRGILAKCETGGAWAAIHVKGDLSSLFEFAMRRGFVETNPIPGLRGLLRVPRSESKAVLSLAQLRDFFIKLRGSHAFPETAMCLRLVALTACRPGEAANAEWSEFDFEERLWRRPAEKMKARREHVSPLSKQAIDLLTTLKSVTGQGRYLFPHKNKDTHATRERLTYAMRDLNLGKGTTPHCWRTTFSTWANEHGFTPDAIEKQLAHVETNQVRATYNKALLIDERRKLMQAWADYLSSAESENVVRVRFGAAS